MAKLDERWTHLETREGILPFSVLSMADCRRAIRRTLPTRHHAKLCVDAIAAALGERAVIDRTFAPDDVRIHVRASDDPRLIVGAPLATLTRGATPGQLVAMTLVNKNGVLPEEAPDGWQPGDPHWAAPTELRPEIVPRGPEMCGGKITIAEGHGQFGVEYDDAGVRTSGLETGGDHFTWLRKGATAAYHLDTLARPPSHAPFSMLARPGLDPAGHTPEQLAELVCASEIAQRVGWRVHVPVAVPMTIEGMVMVARSALRVALFRGEIPADARWIAADGLEGRAIASGASVDDALERFRQAAFAKKPRAPGTRDDDDIEPPAQPPRMEPPSTKTSEDGRSTTISTGTIQLSIPARPLKFPWPRAVPANVPAVLIELPPLPAIPDALAAAGYQRVVRCLGAHGAVGHVFVRDEPGGFTAIGEHVVDIVDPIAIEEELTAAANELEEDLRAAHHEGDEEMTARRIVFVVFDDGHQKRQRARPGQSDIAARLGPPELDGDVAPWRVIRQRGPAAAS